MGAVQTEKIIKHPADVEKKSSVLNSSTPFCACIPKAICKSRHLGKNLRPRRCIRFVSFLYVKQMWVELNACILDVGLLARAFWRSWWHNYNVVEGDSYCIVFLSICTGAQYFSFLSFFGGGVVGWAFWVSHPFTAGLFPRRAVHVSWLLPKTQRGEKL